MSARTRRFELFWKTLGISSPYVAVTLGVFLFRNGFGAVLFYHAILLTCILKLKRQTTISLLFSGFHRIAGPLICLGGLLPGIVILYLWPIAVRGQIDLAGIFEVLGLKNNCFIFFTLYACLINPILEESFWRGCFKNETNWPNMIDVLFAGYHALAVLTVIKFPFVILIFLAMISVGWLFRRLCRSMGGLLVPLLTHIIADIAILSAIWKIIQ